MTGCRAGLAAQRATASDILCRRLARKDQVYYVSDYRIQVNTKAYLARKDQEVEIGARSEARVLYILYDEISARARTM